jgi:hypothetical protein
MKSCQSQVFSTNEEAAHINLFKNQLLKRYKMGNT